MCNCNGYESAVCFVGNELYVTNDWKTSPYPAWKKMVWDEDRRKNYYDAVQYSYPQSSSTINYAFDTRTEVAISPTANIDFEGEEEVAVFLVRIIRDNSKMKLTAKEINLLGFKVVAFDPIEEEESSKLEQIKRIIGEQ